MPPRRRQWCRTSSGRNALVLHRKVNGTKCSAQKLGLLSFKLMVSEKQQVLDEYRKAYMDANGKSIRILQRGGWYYLTFQEAGTTITTNAYRLKHLREMTRTLRQREDDFKAEVLLEPLPGE